MMQKKLLSPISLLVIFTGFLLSLSSCNLHDEGLEKGDLPTLAARGDTIHQDSAANCGAQTLGVFVDAYNQQAPAGSSTSDPYGSWDIVATNTGNAYFKYQLGRGWFVNDYALFIGAGNTVPVDSKGGIDISLFPVTNTLTVARNSGDIQIPLTSAMECPNDNRLFVVMELNELDWLGSPYNYTTVYVQGIPYGSSGVQYAAWCATPCQPLGPPACVVPTPGPGDDLSAYECGNGNQTKVTVCHIPPGNPSNMQQICISTSALPAHIIDFKPVNDPCMGHHSGCHIGPCDPCGPGSTAGYSSNVTSNCPGN